MKSISDHINQKAINEFSSTIKQILGSNVVDIRLFGSVARDTATPESDIDILIIVLKEDKLVKEAAINVAVDVNLDYDVVISPIVMSKEHFMGPLFKETHFYKSVEREGISL